MSGIRPTLDLKPWASGLPEPGLEAKTFEAITSLRVVVTPTSDPNLFTAHLESSDPRVTVLTDPEAQEQREREGFEAWCTDIRKISHHMLARYPEVATHYNPGAYRELEIELMWQAWKARAGL